MDTEQRKAFADLLRQECIPVCPILQSNDVWLAFLERMETHDISIPWLYGFAIQPDNIWPFRYVVRGIVSEACNV
jgi:hypothetical protein